jgi:hypothetical protein
MTMLHGHAEVTTFVDLVRLFLGDLDDEARDELTGGLEADLVDLVEDRGVEALPDPEVYADELRAAAGLPPRPRLGTRRPRRGWSRQGWGRVDAHRDEFLAWADTGPRRGVWQFLVTLRPVWWVLRAWGLLQVVDLTVGSPPHRWLPELGPWWLNLALFAATVVASVQVGRRSAQRRGGAARAALLLGNLVVLAALAPAAHLVRDSTYFDAYEDAEQHQRHGSR